MAKILVVEDEANYRKVLKRKLESRGHVVSTASDGNSVIEMINEIDPDAIILDIVIPGMNGIEVLTTLKKDPDFKKIPIMMLTGVAEIDQMKKCLDRGAVGYIMKGSSMEEIDRKVNVILGLITKT